MAGCGKEGQCLCGVEDFPPHTELPLAGIARRDLALLTMTTKDTSAYALAYLHCEMLRRTSLPGACLQVSARR